MLNMKWTLGAALLAATAAVAQSPSYKGTFTLPVEARFGNTVLEPGNYTISALGNSQGIRVSSDRKSVSVLAAAYDLTREGDKSKITLVSTDDGYALRSFESESMGRSLRFVVTKNKHAERASGKQTTIEVGLQ
jgi:hypothetical protein